MVSLIKMSLSAGLIYLLIAGITFVLPISLIHISPQSAQNGQALIPFQMQTATDSEILRFIIKQNIIVFWLYSSGICCCGITTLVCFCFNGVVLGSTIQTLIVEKHSTYIDVFWHFMPHSIEILAMSIGGGIGFSGVLVVFKLFRANTLPDIAFWKRILYAILLAHVVIVLAALLETYISLKIPW